MTIPAGGAALAAQGAYKSRFGKADAALIEELRGTCDGEVRKDALHATHGEVEFQLRFLPKEQGFTVSVTCPLAGRFRVTRKGALDRRMAAFVPAWRFHSRDERFGRDFNVQTRDLELTSAILTKQPSRAAVRALIERGVTAVHLDGERVKATGSRKVLGGDASAGDILGLVDHLATIAGAVVTFAAHHELRPAPKNDPVVVGSWITLALLGVVGFVMVMGGALEFTLVRPVNFLLPCALLGLPGVPLVIFGLALAVQRRTSPYGLVRGLALLTLLVVPLFVSGALLLSNGALDDSPAAEHLVTVLDTSVRENDGELRYRVGLEPWWSGGDTRWLRISKATYDELEPGVSRMRVLTHPGKWGHEWIEDYSALPLQGRD